MPWRLLLHLLPHAVAVPLWHGGTSCPPCCHYLSSFCLPPTPTSSPLPPQSLTTSFCATGDGPATLFLQHHPHPYFRHIPAGCRSTNVRRANILGCSRAIRPSRRFAIIHNGLSLTAATNLPCSAPPEPNPFPGTGGTPGRANPANTTTQYTVPPRRVVPSIALLCSQTDDVPPVNPKAPAHTD